MSINYKNIGRNDPCPCGSGKKYKQCCQNQQSTNNIASKNRLLETIPELFKQALKAEENQQLELAKSLYQQILDINPKHNDSLNNLSLILLALNEAEAAEHLLKRLIKIEPSTKAYSNLGLTLKDQQKNDEAIVAFKKAIDLNPGAIEAYCNLGGMYLGKYNYQDAAFYLNKALLINPYYENAISNLGICFMQTGHYKLAAQTFKKASLQQPFETRYHQNLLLCLCFDKEAFPTVYLNEAKILEKIFKDKTSQFYKHSNFKANDKLRIGLVSGDFYNHPVGFFLESVISNLIKQPVELFAYNSNFYEDTLTARIKPLFKAWHTIGTLTDSQTAQIIADDNINILIDLSGHTGNNRLSLFAYKAAPIQVSWLGYFASTGMDFMDYFISDRISVTPETKHYFSEQVIYLPKTRLCFTPPVFTPDIEPTLNEPPVLSNNFITFGCFQGLSKINDSMLTLWLKILNQVPNSKLMIKNHQLNDTQVQYNLQQNLLKLGYHKEQFIFEGGSSRNEYLQRYEAVDIILDTFPYPGGTTTCEALWMGVPTLTLSGQTLLERQGESILTNANLTEWVTHTEEEYINKAITFSQHIEQLSYLRHNLRENLPHTPLMNATEFAKDLFKLLSSIWIKYDKK